MTTLKNVNMVHILIE